VRIDNPVLTAVRLIKFRDGMVLPTAESPRVVITTEEALASDKLTQPVEAPDKEMMDEPQQPMPSTSPQNTSSKDGQPDARRSKSQQPTTHHPQEDRVPNQTCRQPILPHNSPHATPEVDEELGAVNPTLLQVKASTTVHELLDAPQAADKETMNLPQQPMPSATSPQNTNTKDALRAHTSGLNEPDMDSLLDLIQKDNGFDEGSKPQRDKVAEAIMAMRDASKSDEWSNLLRGVIILITCLGFPNGDVSEARLDSVLDINK
jgi:hypothetical protein